MIAKKASALLPTKEFGDFMLYMYEDAEKNNHVALVKGEIKKNILVRVHSECFTGDVLHSIRCDCGEQLHAALKAIGKEGGILVYLRQEGRGIDRGRGALRPHPALRANIRRRVGHNYAPARRRARRTTFR